MNYQDMFDNSDPHKFVKNKLISKETVAKIQAKRAGYRHSAETRAKMSASGGHSKDVAHSIETRKKISNALKDSIGKPVMTPKGKFNSLIDAAHAYGFDNGDRIVYRIKKYPQQFYFILESK